MYQWSKRLAGKPWAWNTGWIYLCAQIVTIPAVALAWQVILPQITPKFQFIKCDVLDRRRLDLHRQELPGIFDPAFAKNAFILGRRDDHAHDDREHDGRAHHLARSTTSA